MPFSSVGHILYSKNYLHLCVLLKIHARFLLVFFSTFFLVDELLNLLITLSFRRPSAGWQTHFIQQGKKSRIPWYLILGGIKIVACTLLQRSFVHYDRSPINPVVQSLQVSGIKSFYFFFLVESNASVIRLKDVWNSRWLEDSKAHQAPSSFTGRSFHTNLRGKSSWPVPSGR